MQALSASFKYNKQLTASDLNDLSPSQARFGQQCTSQCKITPDTRFYLKNR